MHYVSYIQQKYIITIEIKLTWCIVRSKIQKINKTTYRQMITLERLQEACWKKWEKKCETMEVVRNDNKAK